MLVFSDAFLFVAKHVVAGTPIVVLLQFILFCSTSYLLAFHVAALRTQEANVNESLLVVLYEMGSFWSGDWHIREIVQR